MDGWGERAGADPPRARLASPLARAEPPAESQRPLPAPSARPGASSRGASIAGPREPPPPSARPQVCQRRPLIARGGHPRRDPWSGVALALPRAPTHPPTAHGARRASDCYNLRGRLVRARGRRGGRRVERGGGAVRVRACALARPGRGGPRGGWGGWSLTDNFRGVPRGSGGGRGGKACQGPQPIAGRSGRTRGGGVASWMSSGSSELGEREGLRDGCGLQPIASGGSERGALCVTTAMKALGRDGGRGPVGNGKCRCGLGARAVLPAAGERRARPASQEAQERSARPEMTCERQALRQRDGAGRRSRRSRVIDRRRRELVQSERDAGLLGGAWPSGLLNRLLGVRGALLQLPRFRSLAWGLGELASATSDNSASPRPLKRSFSVSNLAHF